ncbi:ESCRT-0 subunit protein hse1 [Elasticomyces elasticus]|nr:ESCRT-0 subunit protein hse1 [Elasticomyces elasticus]KAK5000753.1 ESCRT-0 subunit protein hse1 [Elasticomyces elasticus]
MFRAQQNAFDQVVAKATDENLTSENWEYILDVCDRVLTTPTGPKDAIASLIKRLAHRNANVQLYTLELANALSQNCGLSAHKELASRSFTDALLRLASDRNTHREVKSRILERMQEWSEMFKRDPDLGIMEQALAKLRSQNPGLAPPGKPVKREIEEGDRRKEEEELQMALALSVKDKGSSGSEAQAQAGSVGEDGPQPPLQPQGTTAATVSRVRALYDFTPSESGELAFRKNDVIAVLESVYKDWWKGSLRGQTGIFPLNYVEKLQDPTREELERDAAMEGEVFAEIRNVEKLLSLLSVRGEGGGGGGGGRDEDEITSLYHQTLAIRPKLIELIGKYSQKKDDFTQLNEKFIKARRDYEALLESSMSAPSYGARPRQSSQVLYNNYPGGPPPQGYPPQQQQQQPSYPPQQQQQPSYPSQYQGPPSQQEPQRFYSPGPTEPPHSNPVAAGYPYPPQNAPAPFYVIPPSTQPDARNRTSKPSNPPQRDDRSYVPQIQPGAAFAARPQSIHTINSGNPQELAGGGHESPVDARHSYHSSGQPIQNFLPAGYDGGRENSYPPPTAQPQHEQGNQSFDSPDSVYSHHNPTHDGSYPPIGMGLPPQPLPQPQSDHFAPQRHHQQAPPAQYPPEPSILPQHPSYAPPQAPQGQIPVSPGAEANPYPVLNSGAPPAIAAGGYQAYQPQPAQHGQKYSGDGSSKGGDDASDFYR